MKCAESRRVATTQPGGTVTTFTYDAYGQPATKVVDPGSGAHLALETETAYDIVGRPTSRTDGRGTLTAIATDALGRVTQQVVDSGSGHLNLTTSYTFDANGNRTATTQPGGTVTKEDYDALNRLTKTTRGYGLSGFGFETTHAYDANGNVLSTTDAEGNTTSFEYDDDNRRTLAADAASGETATAYDPAGNAITVTDARGVPTSHYYDDIDRRTQTTVDSGSGGLQLTTTYTYGLTGGGGGCGCGTSAGYGRLNKVIDPAGKVTYYYYDLMNRRTKEVRKVSDTDDDGGDSDDGVSETTYDAMGRVTQVRQACSPADYIVATAHDAAGRVASRTVDPGSGHLNLTTTFTHDGAGNVLTETTPAGNVISHAYDLANRRTAATDSIGSVDSRQYDADGNMTRLYTADSRHSDYTYDALDRLTIVADRLGEEATFTYDRLGHELTRTDRNGHVTTTEYDGLYRRTKVIDALEHETQFQYDAVGNLTRLRAVNGGQIQDTLYTYDHASRRTQEQYATTQSDVRNYTHNAAGRLATRTDQNGDVTTYSYDDLHRLTGRGYSRGSGSVSYPTTQGADSFTYDRAGRMTSADHPQAGETFTLDFEHDAAGRLTEQNQDGFTLSHSYAVGSSSHYVQTTYANGRTVKHNLDGRGRVTLITTTTQSVTTTQAANEYDDDNRLLERTFGNGTYATWTYDNEDRVATLKHHCPSCGAGSAAWDFVDLAYGRDAEGKPLYRRHNHATTTSELYAYDDADRLIDFKRGTLNSGGTAIDAPSETQDWTLDALGNWSDFTQGGSSRSSPEEQERTHRADNALTQITIDSTTTNLSYDGPGNLKDDGTHLYDYDCENRLTRVQLKGGTGVPPVVIAEYAYNALGWRVKKTISNSGGLNGTFHLLYNSAWQLLEIRSVSGSTTTVAKQFIHGWHGASSPWDQHTPYIDDHIAMLTPSGGSWATHYYHADALFNTFALTDGSAAVAERGQFEPYGKAALTDNHGDPISTSAIGNPFERQGTVRDWETANDENRRRWYGPAIGRWGQRDPMCSAPGNPADEAAGGDDRVPSWRGHWDGQMGLVERYGRRTHNRPCATSASTVRVYEFCGSQPTAFTDPLGLLPYAVCSRQWTSCLESCTAAAITCVAGCPHFPHSGSEPCRDLCSGLQYACFSGCDAYRAGCRLFVWLTRE